MKTKHKKNNLEPSPVAPLSVIWDLMQGNRWSYGCAIAALVIATGFAFWVPQISRDALDYIIAVGQSGQFSDENRSKLLTSASLIVGITFLSGLFMYLKGKFSAVASEKIACQVRRRLYDHLQRLTCVFHDQSQKGDLVQRCTSDVETVRMFLAVHVVQIGQAFLMLLFLIPILLWMDVRLAFVSLLLVPVVLAFAFFFFKRIKSHFIDVENAEGELTTVIQENLTGIRVVRAFARQDFENQKFGVKNQAYRDHRFRLIKQLAVYWSTSDFLCLAQEAIVLVVGAYWVIGGSLSVGTLFAAWSYIKMLLMPIREMGRILADLGKTLVALGRLQHILNQDEETPGVSQIKHKKFLGHIMCQRLSFAYEKGKGVLSDVSFEVKPGQTLALLGPTGSGKSTLIQLLLRFYDYEQGNILLDGCEIRNLDRATVRSQIDIVMQEPFLYSRSIKDNIIFGKVGSDFKRIEEVAKLASVHESILKFDHGYQTIIGEKGVTLSGGQRQRVALARALLKRAPVLVLDDSLSAVDAKTEKMILSSLRKRAHKQTTILIAHRLSTLMMADQILVLEYGKVTQVGSHNELKQQEGLYKRLWELQTRQKEKVM